MQNVVGASLVAMAMTFGLGTEIQLLTSHRRRLHGAMGAIASTAKKLWGDAPKSPQQECPQVAPTGIL